MRRYPTLLLAAIVLTACTNAGEKLVYPSLVSGQLNVAAYFDRDGNRALSAADTIFSGVRIALLTPGGSDTLYRAVTNASGIAVFDSLPVGTYRVVIDQHALGDSVGVVAGDTGTVRLITTDDSIVATRLIRLGYSEVSLRQARTFPIGRKFYVRGAVTAPLQLFRDTSTFLVDTSGALRVTDALPHDGVSGNNIGDTVLVLGVRGVLNGQPVMLNGLVSTLSIGAPPASPPISVSDANTAKGGTLDAALIQVNGAFIADTVNSDPDFIVILGDPADSAKRVSVLVDKNLGAPHTFFPIGATITVRGVLVPKGDGTWMIKPRNAADFTITNIPTSLRQRVE